MQPDYLQNSLDLLEKLLKETPKKELDTLFDYYNSIPESGGLTAYEYLEIMEKQMVTIENNIENNNLK